MTIPSNTSDFMSEPDTSTAEQIILGDILVSTATPELPSPLLTASGQLTNAALVLVKLTSKANEAHSYLFSPNAKLLALASVASVAFKELRIRLFTRRRDYLLDKLVVWRHRYPSGLAAIDMASWAWYAESFIGYGAV